MGLNLTRLRPCHLNVRSEEFAIAGCGLPPGPGGLLGAAEGVSYLLVVGTVIWSGFTRARTGRGLPPGRLNLFVS